MFIQTKVSLNYSQRIFTQCIFVCYFAASPPATVKWTKNNSSDALQPGPDSNLQILYNERNGEAELKFSTVSVKDGGRYTCHANNEHGLASCVSDLIVKSTLKETPHL